MPVQLGREPVEAADPALVAFYERTLRSCAGPVTDWQLHPAAAAWPGNDSHRNLLVWSWRQLGRLRLVTINFGGSPAQGRVRLEPACDGAVELQDLLDDEIYRRDANELREPGLFVELGPWQAHLLTFEPGAA